MKATIFFILSSLFCLSSESPQYYWSWNQNQADYQPDYYYYQPDDYNQVDHNPGNEQSQPTGI